MTLSLLPVLTNRRLWTSPEAAAWAADQIYAAAATLPPGSAVLTTLLPISLPALTVGRVEYRPDGTRWIRGVRQAAGWLPMVHLTRPPENSHALWQVAQCAALKAAVEARKAGWDTFILTLFDPETMDPATQHVDEPAYTRRNLDGESGLTLWFPDKWSDVVNG